MINGLEGIPGSGKSYEAVVYHVLHALSNGRKVITNLPLILEKFGALDPTYPALIELRRKPAPVRGTWDADRMDDNGNGNAFQLFSEIYPDANPPAPESIPAPEDAVPFGHVWCYYTTWKHPKTGQGPLFIIDECHTSLPKLGTAKEVIQWFKLHRHFNVDVLLMTQMFRDVCPSISGLMEMLIKCRKASFLGKPDSYIRKVCAGYRGAEISVEERQYKPQFFPLYKSHTQGNSVAESLASDVQPFLLKWKRWTRFVWVFVFFGAAFVAWKVYADADKKPLGVGSRVAQPVHRVDPSASRVPTSSAAPLPPGVSPATFDAAPAAPPPVPEPYETHTVHLRGALTLGEVTRHVFVVAQNGQVVSTLTTVEIEAMGYEWLPTTHCSGTLRWYDRQRAVTCDVPAVTI